MHGEGRGGTQGAELLLYPTAIGSERDGSDTQAQWTRVMQVRSVHMSSRTRVTDLRDTEGNERC
jgi:predicted amidohydrolase